MKTKSVFSFFIPVLILNLLCLTLTTGAAESPSSFQAWKSGLNHLDAFGILPDGSCILLAIGKPGEVLNLEHGSPRTAAGLLLPPRVSLCTTFGYKTGQVKWNTDKCDYKPEQHESQEFIVEGAVRLPDHVANPYRIPLTVSIPVSVEAREPVSANLNDNQIDWLAGDEEITTETTIHFRAIGAGMENDDPIPGDTRYIPSSWKVLESRAFTSDDFATSFRIAKEGGFTLSVIFTGQKYNGTEWVDTEEEDEQHMTFNVLPSDHHEPSPVSTPVDTDDHSNFERAMCVFMASALGILFLLLRTAYGRR